MFLDIGRTQDRSAPERVADRLLACHERIRRFSALGAKIASSPDAPADELAEAAGAVHRYFTVALPLHVADEDDSIKPLLLAAPVDASVAAALETVTREHETIEALIAALAPLWSAASAKRAGAAELAREGPAAARLETLLQSHLTLEEGVVFPSLRQLSDGETRRIVAEMRARR